MSGFSVDWLNLREGADLRARDPSLLNLAIDWLKACDSPAPVVVDLGAGTGASLRALGETKNAHDLRASWRLLDNDDTLLAEANRRHGDSQQLEIFPVDLNSITTRHLEGARLITASALFDLVSLDFIETLIESVTQASAGEPVGIYAALNYDGITEWEPGHPLDKTVLAAFNRDQRRDKGFGPALGPDAGNRLIETLKKAEFEVHGADSPWLLDADDVLLVNRLIEGMAKAVVEYTELDLTALADWIEFRQLNATSGTCKIGHTDVLAFK